MNNTNPKKFRAEMKDYLDMAAKEPIRIQRREGGSFILMAEDKYAAMQQEIMSLQRRLLSSSQILKGEVTEHKLGDYKARVERFKKRA